MAAGRGCSVCGLRASAGGRWSRLPSSGSATCSPHPSPRAARGAPSALLNVVLRRRGGRPWRFLASDCVQNPEHRGCSSCGDFPQPAEFPRAARMSRSCARLGRELRVWAGGAREEGRPWEVPGGTLRWCRALAGAAGTWQQAGGGSAGECAGRRLRAQLQGRLPRAEQRCPVRCSR